MGNNNLGLGLGLGQGQGRDGKSFKNPNQGWGVNKTLFSAPNHPDYIYDFFYS